MSDLARLDAFYLAKSVAELAEDRPRVMIERLLKSLDEPLIFDQLVDELAPTCYVEERVTL